MQLALLVFFCLFVFATHFATLRRRGCFDGDGLFGVLLFGLDTKHYEQQFPKECEYRNADSQKATNYATRKTNQAGGQHKQCSANSASSGALSGKRRKEAYRNIGKQQVRNDVERNTHTKN